LPWCATTWATPGASPNSPGSPGSSPKALERLCGRTLGISPQRLVQRLRLEYAVHLITTTGATLGEVSADCGFYDQSSFTKQFRAVLGLTPGAYRRHGSGRPAPTPGSRR
jgi:AraC-like DNA-binding protein